MTVRVQNSTTETMDFGARRVGLATAKKRSARHAEGLEPDRRPLKRLGLGGARCTGCFAYTAFWGEKWGGGDFFLAKDGRKMLF